MLIRVIPHFAISTQRQIVCSRCRLCRNTTPRRERIEYSTRSARDLVSSCLHCTKLMGATARRYVSLYSLENEDMTRLVIVRSSVGLLACSVWLLLTSSVVAQAVVLESGTMGAPGRVGGASITTVQYIGWRFQTNQTLTVDHVGGHLLSIPDVPGNLFAAIIRLPSITSIPIGAPFDPSEIVATTTFRASFPSAEVLTPLSTTLSPGSYTLMIGTDQFGATGEGAAPNYDDQSDIPPANLSSFIFWSRPNQGQPLEWRQNLASHMRFVIQAQVAIPGDFNHNSVVDAADYVVWRNTAGPASDYNIWRANFGRSSGTGSGVTFDSAASSVPEPTPLAMIVMATIACFPKRSLRASDAPRTQPHA